MQSDTLHIAVHNIMLKKATKYGNKDCGKGWKKRNDDIKN
jgi:hypothetical protein